MTLRAVLLAIAIVLFVCAVGATILAPEAWPAVFWTGIMALALGIERRLYGAAQSGRPGPGWQATGERFVDDASGKRVEVWFDPASGERRYIDAE